MKASVLALACFLLLAVPGPGHTVEVPELDALLGHAIGDDAKMCAFLDTINQEIAAHPGDEHLLQLRIAAYDSLLDPYSAKPDVDLLAAMHPDSPMAQLGKCMYAEATGAEKSEYLACYNQVADLFEKQGKATENSADYLFVLLLAESPKAAAVKQRFLDNLTDSPMDQESRAIMTNFSREMWSRRVDPSEVRHPCAQKR